MAVRLPQKKQNYVPMDVDEIINRGGKTVSESSIAIEDGPDEQRFTLRIPKALLSGIDKKRKSSVGKVSRNQWILEVIAAKLGE